MTYRYPVSDPALAGLQRTMLTAALLGQRLPGAQRPLLCPGIDQLLKQQTIYIDQEHLASSFSEDWLPRPVQTVTTEELVELARANSGPVHFLKFEPVEYERRVIMLTLESNAAFVNSPIRLTSHGAVQSAFHETSDGWQAAREPIIYGPE